MSEDPVWDGTTNEDDEDETPSATPSAPDDDVSVLPSGEHFGRFRGRLPACES